MGQQFRIESTQPTAASNIAFEAPQGSLFRKLSITSTYVGNTLQNSSPSTVFKPPYIVTELYSFTLDNGDVRAVLDKFDSYQSGIWTGGTLFRMRDVGGELQVAELPITDCIIKTLKPIHQQAYNAMPEGASSCRDGFASYFKPSAPVYYAVAFVNDTGQRGNKSASVTHTISATPADVTITRTDTATATNYDARTYNAAIPTPANVTATSTDNGNAVTISWTPVAGYRAVVLRSFHPDMINDQRLVVTGGNTLLANDGLVIKKEFPNFNRDFLSPRGWGIFKEYIPFALRGLPPFKDMLPAGADYEYRTEGGKDCLRITVPSGSTLRMDDYCHAGSGQGYYEVLRPGNVYRQSIVAKKVSGTGSVKNALGTVSTLTDYPLTSSWATHSKDYTVSTVLTGSNPSASSTDFVGPIVVDVAQSYIFNSTQGPAFEVTGDELDLMLSSEAAEVRVHGTIKTRTRTYRPTDAYKMQGLGEHRGQSVLSNAVAAKKMRDTAIARGDIPINDTSFGHWPQIDPPYQTDADMRFHTSAFCEPYDPANGDTPQSKPGAYARYSALLEAGLPTTPIQDWFPHLIFESSNELWNNLEAFFNLPGISGHHGGWGNGKILQRWINAFKATPGFQREKWDFYLGLWAADGISGWNTASIQACPEFDICGYANYVNGIDSGQNGLPVPNDDYWDFQYTANHLASDYQSYDKAAELVVYCEQVSATRDRPIRVYQYEGGPGYNFNVNTVEGSQNQLKAVRTNGCAAAYVASTLALASVGVVGNNFFTWGFGEAFQSHTPQSGAMVPAAMWVPIMNRLLPGYVAKHDMLKKSALINYEGTKYPEGTMVFTIEAETGETAFVLYNSDIARSADFLIRLPTTNKAWKRIHATGEWDTHNTTPATADAIEIVTTDMADGFGDRGFEVTVPPGMVEMYVRAA